jgi:hypothetical protein
MYLNFKYIDNFLSLLIQTGPQNYQNMQGCMAIRAEIYIYTYKYMYTHIQMWI